MESPESSMDDSGSRKTSNRGFAAMDPEKQRRIASEGGAHHEVVERIVAAIDQYLQEKK